MSVLLAEATLRALGRIAPRPLLVRGCLDVHERIDANRLTPHTIYVGLPLNARGYNDEEFGPKQAGIRRVVSISDSFAFAPVPYTHHFTAVAEQNLGGVEVLNLGVSSIGPVEYAQLLVDEVLPLEPDLVLVNVFVGNDIEDVWREPIEAPDLIPGLFDPRNVLIAQVPGRISRWIAERRRGAAIAALPQAPLTPAEMERRLPRLIDPALETPQFSEEAFLDIERRRAQFLLRRASTQKYRAVVRWLEWMRERARPVPLVVMILPDEFQVEDSLTQECLAPIGGTLDELDKPQRILKELLEQKGFQVLDVLPALQAVAPMQDGKRHLYRLRDTHFNARGCRVAGMELARFLEPKLGVAPLATASASTSSQ